VIAARARDRGDARGGRGGRPTAPRTIALAVLAIAAAALGAPAPTPPAPPPVSKQRSEELRREIAGFEALLSSFPDRAAVQWALAFDEAELGDSRGALARLEDCVAAGEGFDPSHPRTFRFLHGNPEFEALCARARAAAPPVSAAKLAFTVAAKDLIPEGLAYDESRKVLYLGSLNRRFIVRLGLDGKPSDLFPPGRHGLLPVLGIRVAPSDATIWANTFADEGRTELVHFDGSGRLLGRFSPSPTGKHGLNDLVVRRNGEVIATDSLDGRVYRFEPALRVFSPLAAHRSLFYPNGIALAADDRTLYVADAIGVVCFDLSTGRSRDVAPAKETLAGIDGMYWNRGSLVAVQNGIGARRIAAFRLSKEGGRVESERVLERGTSMTTLPTTGAIAGERFYFIANSQIDNFREDRIVDLSRLEPVRIAVLTLPD